MTADRKNLETRETGDARPVPPDSKTPASPPAERAVTHEQTVRLLGETHADGFASDEPEWVTYCPRCGVKLAFDDHKTCPHFEGEAHTPDGTPIAVRCAYPPPAKPKSD